MTDLSNVVGVIYPQETSVLDVVDLLPRVTEWIDKTSQNMGNWVSKEQIKQELADINIQSAPVSKGNVPLKLANEVLQNNRSLVVIGFDVLQIPQCKMTFRIKEN